MPKHTPAERKKRAAVKKTVKSPAKKTGKNGAKKNNPMRKR